MTSQYPRLANLGDVPRLLSGDRVSHEWPPPGTTEVGLGFPETWVLVQGPQPPGDVGDWYVTDLEHVAVSSNQTVLVLAARLGLKLSGLPGLGIGAVGQWPVIYEVGKVNFMRWISTVFRGTLGGVEQFQHGINFGVPGNDPTLGESEAPAYAEALATRWQATMGVMFNSCADDVQYTEVGVVEKTQTDPTDAQGNGGNLEQSYPTAFYGYGVGANPHGVTGAKSLPYEVACAVTLQTDTRGPRGRGRLYLPPFATALVQGGGGKFADVDLNAIGGALGDFFEAHLVAEGHVPVVVSRRAIQLHEVTSIKMGHVPDSQRRRRRSVAEAPVVAWTKP